MPPGLPSDLIDRRPDIRSAEQQLVAANADIGQAKAAFFPKVTLTGFYGFQSVALSDLFKSGSQTWQFGPAVSVPLFTGGALRGNLKLAQARFEEAVAQYQKTVQNSFREVSDSLIAYQRTREFRARQEELTQANRNAADLANIRYEGGVTSYLEVLYNEQELFSCRVEPGPGPAERTAQRRRPLPRRSAAAGRPKTRWLRNERQPTSPPRPLAELRSAWRARLERDRCYEC